MNVRLRAAAVLCLALIASLVAGGVSRAQLFPGTTTTTTAAPTTTEDPTATSTPTTGTPTTAEPTTTTGLLGGIGGGGDDSTTTTSTSTPSADDPTFDDSATAPPGAEDIGGDGAAAPIGNKIPSEAQRIINSVKRSKPNNSQVLVDGAAQLVALGVPQAEAERLAYGRFPIAGYSHWSHDWLYPRFGPGFRFHLGCDMFAASGTPVRAPVDGIAEIGNNALGGLTVKVFMPDGTYFYLAHLSAVTDDYVEGKKPVLTGDIVGYVGNTGNAISTPPHLHIGVYPKGGAAVDPKPIMDSFVAEAAARLPLIIQQVRQQQNLGSAPAGATAVPAPRPLLGSVLLRPLTDRLGNGLLPTEVLYTAANDPAGGGTALAAVEATRLGDSIDWSSRALTDELAANVTQRRRALVRAALSPFLSDLSARLAAADQ